MSPPHHPQLQLPSSSSPHLNFSPDNYDTYYSQNLPLSPPHHPQLQVPSSSPLRNFSPDNYDAYYSQIHLMTPFHQPQFQIPSYSSSPWSFSSDYLDATTSFTGCDNTILASPGDEMLILRIQHLTLLGDIIHQENIELYKKVNLIRQENTELHKKRCHVGTSVQSLTAIRMVKKQNKRKQSSTICERAENSVRIEDLQQHSHRSVAEAARIPDASTSPGAVGCSSASLNRCNRVGQLMNTGGLITSMELNVDEQSIEPVKSPPDQLETLPDGIEMTIPNSLEQHDTIETHVETKVGDVGISVQSLAATTMAKKQNKLKISPIKGGRSKKSVQLVDLQNCSHLTLKEAASSLDVSKSTLKRRCRENGISEWSEMKDINLSEKSAEISFTLETLLQNSNKSLEEAAKALGVSETTLRCICKDRKISQWSDLRRISLSEKGIQCTLTTNTHSGDAFNTFQPEMAVQHIQEYGGVNHQFCFQPQNQSVTTSPPKTTMQDVRPLTVKATYEKKMIKFKLFPWSKREDLEEQVTKRLKLEVGSFHLEYKDEEGDSIFIGCESDLKDCMNTLTSLNKTTVKMLVSPITN